MLRTIVGTIATRDRSLADQVRRAATSIALNLAEGNASSSGNRRLRFESALGSARETRTGLRVAVAWGYVDRTTVAPVDALLDRVAAQTYQLSRR